MRLALKPLWLSDQHAAADDMHRSAFQAPEISSLGINLSRMGKKRLSIWAALTCGGRTDISPLIGSADGWTVQVYCQRQGRVPSVANQAGELASAAMKHSESTSAGWPVRRNPVRCTLTCHADGWHSTLAVISSSRRSVTNTSTRYTVFNLPKSACPAKLR